MLKFDASSLPVALVTVKGEGLNETQLHDYAQFQIRNQIAVVPGAEIPGVFGGTYRQIMVYVDPYKLLSRQLSLMDVVGAVNDANLILPAGDVKMGPYDYYRLFQQPGRQHGPTGQGSAQGQGALLGHSQRCWEGGRRAPDSNQHRTH